MSYPTDPKREDRVDELMADCMDMEEVYVAWYYYFAENLDFPISAIARLKKRGGSAEDIEVRIVDVVSEADRDIKLGYVLTMKGLVHSIDPKDLVSVDTSEENLEILNDWLYWKRAELLD